MKNKFLVAVFAVLGLTTVISCSSDDNSSSSKYEKEILGIWKDAGILFLDKNDQVVFEEEPYDEGCGVDQLEINSSTMVYREFFMTEKGCANEVEEIAYSIKGDRLYHKETKESNKIVQLTENKLVIEGEAETITTDIFSAVSVKTDVDIKIEKVYFVFVR